MPSDPLDILKRVFGFQSFRPLQEEIVARILDGQDAFVLMPTGGGKSLCFQLPALLRQGVGIVVSPLISLMKDQVDALRASGVRAAYYNSSLGQKAARQVLAELHAGQLDLLYIAPERLMSPGFLERLRDMDVALIAIDEAHCISQWGHDFRPEYTQLGVLRRSFPGVPLVALTATADVQTRQDILSRLELDDDDCFVTSFDRPNIRYTVLEKHQPARQLMKFLAGHGSEAGIVYALSRKRVEEVAKKLCDAGLSAAAYHAGLGDGERQRVQDEFLRDELQIVVATVAFGMGIDKSNVRFVVHYDLPKNIEGYYQETGRAGRDGLAAEALLLFGYGDIALCRGLIEKGHNEEQNRIELHKLNAMASFAEALTCRRQVLLGYFGEHATEDCGNCDICLQPPETYDATEDARKALSCVYRVGQRFGAGHVIDVLRGTRNERMLRLGHDRLSTYGIGADVSRDAWGSLVRQLVHRGYLYQDVGNYSVLRLTEKARPLLRGEITLQLAKPRIKVKAVKKPSSRSASEWSYDVALFDALRTLRKQIADHEHVPPFVVFSDATLAEMAARRPRDEAALLSVNGVGQRKLQRYGEDFLALLIDY
ncbi:ATP-dependent DNA helicase RecQ [Syntrophotalea carbinolica DSM 2380]|uniref:DNA helicase RecQ n=1 Tax=Syntrophotalea carbinolica (strain DSM 2380 / NBRC 103641 / GraBd1) TaxID=338963 RepID=Q3A1Y8_SYNC1|nr:ATP-dependent DNA helicase RecQ [Syntrophotalea carbinolica DSM 2380]